MRNQSNRRRAASNASAVELLEPRRLLSAAVSHGVLTIEGTRRADTIVLTMDSPRTMRVRVGNVESTFLKKSFSQIRISGGLGDDLVTIGSDASPIVLPAVVSGDDGADTVIGGAGNDSISGGAGADQITGAAGDDSVNGDNGNDDLHGGDGRDLLCGGKGDDELHDDAGRDSVVGNAGADLVYFHDDVKQFRDLAGVEKSYAEPVFEMAKLADAKLVLNKCPLYAPDGKQFSGGLVKAGGSTLVMSGNVLKQWDGEGLGSSNVTVPHFELPGGSYSGAGSGVIDFGYGSYGSGITLVGIGGAGGYNVYGSTIKLTGDQTLTIPSGSIITTSNSSTQSIAGSQTLAVAGPSTITTPTGRKYAIADGVTVTVIGTTSTIEGGLSAFFDTDAMTLTGYGDLWNIDSSPQSEEGLPSHYGDLGDWNAISDHVGSITVEPGTLIEPRGGLPIVASEKLTPTFSNALLTYIDGQQLLISGSWTVTVSCLANNPLELNGRYDLDHVVLASSFGSHTDWNTEILGQDSPAWWQVNGYHSATLRVPSGTLLKHGDGSTIVTSAGSTNVFGGGNIVFSSGEYIKVTGGWSVTVLCPSDQIQ